MSLAEAIRARDPSRLPSRRDENWRWTDLRGLIRELPAASPTAGAVGGGGPWAALGGAESAVVNGRGPGVVDAAAGEIARLRWVSTAEAGSHTGAVQVRVGADESLLLLESYEGAEAGYLAGAELDIAVEAGGRLTRLTLADDAVGGSAVSTATVRLAAGAAFAQTTLTAGARRQRLETHVAHPGGGAEVRIDGVYLLRDKRHADLTSVVTHMGRDGVTLQLTKGVAADAARGVFQGRIVVEEGADGTDARMGHHALLLSDRAEIDAKPELEIFADDVSCAHGNTVGALDEEALFYALSRGIPEPTARAMLMEAFVGEVVDRIEHEGAREIARAWVAARLTVAA